MVGAREGMRLVGVKEGRQGERALTKTHEWESGEVATDGVCKGGRAWGSTQQRGASGHLEVCRREGRRAILDKSGTSPGIPKRSLSPVLIRPKQA